MEKQTFLIIGLIGGILAVVGIFLPWINISIDYPGWGTRSESGWDLRARTSSSYLALTGGIIVLLGGLALLKEKRLIGLLLPMGGAIAIFGGIMAYFDVKAIISGIGIPKIFPDWGYGFLVCIIGGILAFIGGALSLKV